MRATESLIIGDSHHAAYQREQCEVLGPRQCCVVATGESGTGKTLLARELHRLSGRARFVRVSGAQLDPNLARAELGGHVRGAFTGATQDRIGLVEAAYRATFFMDEGGDTPVEGQAFLLDVIEGEAIRVLGGSRTFVPDVRVLFAVHTGREALVKAGFRRDLAARLWVAEIRLLPLRERPEDIVSLTPHLLRRAAAAEGLAPLPVSASAMKALLAFDWPDNIRQLGTELRRALIDASHYGHQEITVADLSEDLRAPAPRRRATRGSVDRTAIEAAIRRTGGNATKAAKVVRLPKRTFYRAIESNGINLEALRRAL